MRSPEPLTVDLVRATRVENRHSVAAVAVRVEGSGTEERIETLASWGDPERPTHPRSSIKLLQAIPLVESGAADAFELGDVELALACASHRGEPDHLDVALDWLARIGLPIDALECGVQPGRDGTPVGNCCSGKHAGFLTLARHLGVDHAGYINVDHPVQQRVRDAVARSCGVDLSPDAADIAVDGCGIPIYPVALSVLAASGARVARAMATEPDSAAARLARAMTEHPWHVAGTGAPVSEAMAAAGGRLVAKDGAEGVWWAAIPGGSGSGIGVAAKCLDGSNAAADAAVGHLFERLGLIDEATADVFAAHRRVTNHAGDHVADRVVLDPS